MRRLVEQMRLLGQALDQANKDLARLRHENTRLEWENRKLKHMEEQAEYWEEAMASLRLHHEVAEGASIKRLNQLLDLFDALREGR